MDIEAAFSLVSEGEEAKHYDTHADACAENPENHVWAVVEGEEGYYPCTCEGFSEDSEDSEDFEHDSECKYRWPDYGVLPGWHLVNVLYYVATLEPWDPDDPNQYTY